jgi:hypothetical protein
MERKRGVSDEGTSTVIPRARFQTSVPLAIRDRQLTMVRLSKQDGHISGVDKDEGGIRFGRTGWFEVLLTVDWDVTNRRGHRFSHTALPDQHPLHSEAIEADVLAELSDGRQLLRGNGLFGPTSIDRITLEVWQDSGIPVRVERASLEVRARQ